MIDYKTIFVPLSAVLGLSLIIERVLELSKNLLERVISQKTGRKIPQDKEYEKALLNLDEAYKRDKLARQVEKKLKQQAKDRQKLITELNQEKKKDKPDIKKIKLLKQQLLELEQDGEWDEDVPGATVLVEPAKDPDDGSTMRAFILQLIGFAAGIIAAHVSGIRLFSIFLDQLSDLTISKELDFILTGLLIGGGSGPVHVLISFITQNKITTSASDVSESTEQPEKIENGKAPAVIKNPATIADENWAEIPYLGGVDRDQLEFVHIREQNPDLIVFHHTAMHSQSTFEDVVRVIKDRKDSYGNNWLTGYNCVVLASGSIHPFCRWDRFGNHVAGYNMHSLGIALNGNFETNPNVASANTDGRHGSWRPPEIQLKSAARVITLWTFLYGIKIDFAKNILPHRQFSNTSCPGSNFPYDEFHRWIDFYYKKWSKSTEIKEKIEAYKLKPYIYVQNGKEA